MKKVFVILAIAAGLFSCKKEDKSSSNDTPCGDHKNNQLYKESTGKCYYLDNGNRVYVENHECSC
jgi:hypothetical protein